MKGMGTRCARMGAAALLAGATLVLGAGATMASTHQRDADSSPGASGQGQGSANGHSGHSGPGDSNSGDVWLDNSGQPAGPGHEHDPHLACADITLYGAHLADSSGTFAIDSWPPSGSQQQVYTSTWTYNTAAGGTQPIATISVTQLVQDAIAAGAAPVNKNGFHFKLDLSQDPQKHKTFWVSCPAASGTAAAGPGAVATAAPTEEALPTGAQAAGTGSPAGATAAAAASPAATQSVGSGTTGAVQGLTTTTPAAPPASSAPGGVLGLSTTVPATGAGIAAGVAVALIAIGLAVIAASRRRTTARL